MRHSGPERVYGLIACAAIFLVAGVFAWVPVVYDTLHLRDTLFLTEIGWRTYNGLEPALGFGHLYGGVTAEYISVAMSLAGPTIKALDYATLLQCITVLALLAVVSYRRLSGTVLITLAVLCTGVMLARAPLEEVLYLSQPISAHSFVYNRFGTALMICVAMFVVVPARVPFADDLTAFICGGVCFVLILTKPTFFLPSIAVILTLLLQFRLRNLAVWALGFAITICVLDPWAARIFAALEYNVVIQGQGNTNLTGLLRKASHIVYSHQLALVMALALIGHLLIVGNWPARRMVLSALIVLAAYCGTAVSFGPVGLIGHQALPLIAGICLAVAAYEPQRSDLTKAMIPGYATAFGVVLSLMVAAPHMSNTLATAGIAVLRSDRLAITTGPMKNYLAHSRDFPPRVDTAQQDPAARRAVQVETHIAQGSAETAGRTYTMLVDGIALLRPLGDLSERGIVSGSGVVFSFAMGSKAIADFPVWVLPRAPELAADSPLSDEIDLVLISRLTEFELGAVLKLKMAEMFSLCDQSGIWSVYARNTSQIEGCAL